MADIIYRTFDPDADPAYKKTWTDRLIQIKSRYTHTEIQYSDRYGGISASATMADGCNCFRFKMIDYTKHPLRWKSVIIPCTDEQEDLIWDEDCRMAGMDNHAETSMMIDVAHGDAEYFEPCFFGPNAMKYDKWGVIFCNISHRRIIGSSDKLVWCTESRIMTPLKVYPDLTDKHPDEFRPDNGHRLIEEYVRNLTA